ncbi:hypothetical protein BDY19DRAFT_880926 [Irpex rosettiformis]|uniref:Uncharacterized protein n=1 Tax=Irpex rosettiformis TaxID=378272 RepID=A0ACB8UIT7_9APHY|nr:hypothetical protein BDY19DRAFT_880926 [Irpex rosettiformis]
MPPGPVLLTLSLWAQGHITALFKATTTQEFDDAFDAFLAHRVDTIVVNGEKLTRDQYKSRLQAARSLEQSAEVKYLGTVEVQDARRAGEVGTFLTAEIFEKVFIFGAPASETVTISFNLK